MKTYYIKFSFITSPDGTTYAPYQKSVEAKDLDDAQEKVIDYLENLGMTHGEILSIHAVENCQPCNP